MKHILPLFISSITSLFLLLLAPNAIANSNADKVNAFFGEATNICYSRYYSDDHLKKHPDQKVKAIHFEHIRDSPEVFDEESGAFNGSIYVQLKDDNWYYGTGSCDPGKKGFICGLEDDNGVYNLQKKGSKESPTLLISHNNLYLWDYDNPEDAEPTGEEDTRKLLSAEPSDKSFLLKADLPKSCLEDFKIEVSDGIEATVDSSHYKKEVTLQWKTGGKFKFPLNAYQEIEMIFKDSVLTAVFNTPEPNHNSKPVTVFDFNNVDEEERYVEFSITGEDYDFDGFNDFSIITSIGYGGVNTVEDVFLYDANVNNFVKSDVLSELSNIELDYGTEELTTSRKGSRHTYSSRYRFDSDKPWQYSQTTWLMSDAEYVVIYNHPAKSAESAIESSKVVDTSVNGEDLPLFRYIAVDKANLYEEPRDPTESGMYLIKGDEVQIIDFTETNNGSGDWVLIRFKGKKLVEQWTPFESVDWGKY